MEALALILIIVSILTVVTILLISLDIFICNILLGLDNNLLDIIENKLFN